MMLAGTQQQRSDAGTAGSYAARSPEFTGPVENPAPRAGFIIATEPLAQIPTFAGGVNLEVLTGGCVLTALPALVRQKFRAANAEQRDE
jgi:hypothetical protein